VAGVFVSRGMTIAIPQGGLSLSIGPGGELSASLMFHVRFDVCPTWCELAVRHLADAAARRAHLMAVWTGTDEIQKASALEREFEASMQAIMAAAIAWDAFYSVVKTHVNLPPSLIQQWRDKRTARYAQITEVVRRGFKLKPRGTALLRQNLKEIYRLRDLAVHPSGKIEAPILHPELSVGVEWRFAHFRVQNAEVVVNATTGMLWDLAHGGKPTCAELVTYMNALCERLKAVFPAGHPSMLAPASAP
jgi:hypothetical protein